MESPANRPAELARELPHALRPRRRSVRQKVHIPAYANLNGSRSGMVLDLNEIIDISEDGICIQTSSPLKQNHKLPVSLDLAETKAFIHTTGHVVWTDKGGRAGVHFPEMPPQSRQQLREWLFANAIAACVNHAEVKAPLAFADANRLQLERNDSALGSAQKEDIPGELLMEAALRQFATAQIEPPEAPAPLDYSALLSGLAAVQREVELLGSNQDQALQVIAGCSLTFTRATGAAVALSSEFLKQKPESEGESHGGGMICAAVAGCDAPPLDSRLQVGSGFSGECVRSRKLLSCEDAETDSRVDRETCRALGIRSMVAVPVLRDGVAVALLEVFSQKAHAFVANDHTVLERMAEMIAGVFERSHKAVPEPQPEPAAVEWEFPDVLRFGEVDSEKTNYKYSKALLIAAVATLLIVLLWLLVPRGKSKSATHNSELQQKEETLQPAPAPVLAASDLEGIRRLADQGDVTAEYALGVRYSTGDEVKEDYSEAVNWFTKAAEQGSVPAQATLGAYYWAGRGVQQDLKKAYFWAVLAQAGGDQGSKYRTAVLASRLSRSQIVGAEQQADEWIKAHQLSARK